MRQLEDIKRYLRSQIVLWQAKSGRCCREFCSLWVDDKTSTDLIGVLFTNNICGGFQNFQIWACVGVEWRETFSCIFKDTQGQSNNYISDFALLLEQVTWKMMDRKQGPCSELCIAGWGGILEGAKSLQAKNAIQTTSVSSTAKETLCFLQAWFMQGWCTPWYLGLGEFFNFFFFLKYRRVPRRAVSQYWNIFLIHTKLMLHPFPKDFPLLFPTSFNHSSYKTIVVWLLLLLNKFSKHLIFSTFSIWHFLQATNKSSLYYIILWEALQSHFGMNSFHEENENRSFSPANCFNTFEMDSADLHKLRMWATGSCSVLQRKLIVVMKWLMMALTFCSTLLTAPVVFSCQLFL